MKAAVATCRISDIDITAKGCVLKFGARTVSLAGRQAHELYATLIETGVPSSGAAGSITESVKALACTIDPAAVREKSGGGAPTAPSPSINEAAPARHRAPPSQGLVMERLRMGPLDSRTGIAHFVRANGRSD